MCQFLPERKTGALWERGRKDICTIQGKLKFESTIVMVMVTVLLPFSLPLWPHSVENQVVGENGLNMKRGAKHLIVQERR
jgi:hypothetical protein